MKPCLLVLSILATLLLRREMTGSFMALNCRMHVYSLIDIASNLSYMLPFLLLTMICIDDIRCLNENKSMILVRMPSKQDYRKREGEIMFRECMVYTSIYNVVLLVATRDSFSLDVLEIMMRNTLIVITFSEMFGITMLVAGNEMTLVLIVAAMAVTSFTGMSMIYKTGKQSLWNIVCYNVTTGSQYHGNWRVILTYVVIAILMEYGRRRMR